MMVQNAFDWKCMIKSHCIADVGAKALWMTTLSLITLDFQHCYADACIFNYYAELRCYDVCPHAECLFATWCCVSSCWVSFCWVSRHSDISLLRFSAKWDGLAKKWNPLCIFTAHKIGLVGLDCAHNWLNPRHRVIHNEHLEESIMPNLISCGRLFKGAIVVNPL